MSSAIYDDAGRLDDLTQFYRDYYRKECGRLANAYPRDRRSLTIQWSDLYSSMPDFADDLLKHPHGGDSPDIDPLNELHEALYQVDLPIPEDFQHEEFADAHVRVQLPRSKRVGLGELRARHRGKYVAVSGQIERVTQHTERIKTATFVCTKCGTQAVDIPQPRDTLEEPSSCPGSCSGKPSFRLDEDASETVDERKMKLSQPPEDAEGSGEELTVYLEDDLAFADGERGLMGMAGERVTVHGILKRDKSQTRGRSAKPLLDGYMNAYRLEFEGSIADDINIEEYRDDIQRHRNADDTLQRLIDSVAPGIQGGERMQQVKRGIVLYLFRAMRKTDGSSALRGDIHLALIGDPSTGKTQLLDFIEAVSPRTERLSATDGSGAGLTATAEQDEFAGGNWVLTPGLLPLASGGHAIVDEIDKMNEGIDKLHEAMETQRVHVAKAGMRATLKTEAGVVIAANPVEGRFRNTGAQVLQEIELPPALFSRFDIIHTLRDSPDEAVDENVADAVLSRWQSAADEDDSTDVTGPVELETFRAWIADAQDSEPVLSEAAKDRLAEWYVKERSKEWDESADIVPITARSVPAAARLAEAHASIFNADKIRVEDAEVAIDVIQGVMGDVYMDDKGRPDVDIVTGATPTSQKERREAVKQLIDEPDGTVSIKEVRAQADEEGIDPDKVEQDIQHWKDKGVIYERRTDQFNTT